MNKMPSFTAESSLNRTSSYSYMKTSRVILTSQIQPQARVIRVPTIEIKCYCGGYCSPDGTCRTWCFCQ